MNTGHTASGLLQDFQIRHWLVLALLAFGMLRAGSVLEHSPLIGMANNYDMIRVQGCIDAYPIRDPAIPAWSNSWQAPLERYQFRDDIHPGCFVTSEALFAFAALPFMHWQAQGSADGGFSLRTVGWVKFLCLVGFSVWVTWYAFRAGRADAALAHALVFAVLVADPAVMVYLNSFYAEFASVFFAYAALALIALARRDAAPSISYLTLVGVLLALACISKVQHVALGFFVLAVAMLSARFGRTVHGSVALALAAGAIIGMGTQAMQLRADHTVSMHGANLTHTVLGAVLGTSEEPHRTATNLGLPAGCGDHAGKNWFTPGLRDNHPCPELLEMSRLRLLTLAAAEPGLVARVYWGAVEKARPWTSDHFGLVAGQSQARLPKWMFSFNTVLNTMPMGLFVIFLLSPSLIMGVAWIGGARIEPSLAILLFTSALYPPTALAVVVFGDGYADVAKQFHLGTFSALAFWLFGAMWVWRAWVRPDSTGEGHRAAHASRERGALKRTSGSQPCVDRAAAGAVSPGDTRTSGS